MLCQVINKWFLIWILPTRSSASMETVPKKAVANNICPPFAPEPTIPIEGNRAKSYGSGLSRPNDATFINIYI